MEFVIEAMNDTVRLAMKSQDIKARYPMRMKISKLFGEQLRVLECSIEDYRQLAEDYRLKNVFSDIYRQYDKKSASEVLWYHDAQALGTQAMKTAFESIYSRREGILVWYDESINNGLSKPSTTTYRPLTG